MSSDATEITARFEAMERSLRRIRAALFATGLLATVGFGRPWLVGAAAKPQTIRAAEFDVVDASGRTRAALGMEGGAARLALYDEAGTKVVYLTEGKKMAPLNEHARGWTHSGPEFDLYDPLRKGGAYLTVGYGAILEFTNTPGNLGAVLSTQPALGSSRGSAMLWLSDNPRTVTALLSANINRAALNLYDQAGRLRAVLGNTGEGNASVRTPVLPAGRPESSLVLLDSDGKVLWKAP